MQMHKRINCYGKSLFANRKFGASGVVLRFGIISLIAKRISVLQECSSAME